MKNKFLLVILYIICGLVILAIVFLEGVHVGSQSAALQPGSPAKLQNLLTSKVIQTSIIVAYGTVSGVENGNITLTSFPPEKENLEIPISQDAKISMYVISTSKKSASPSVTTEKTISLKDINIGDIATVSIKINSGGQFQGTAIQIFPRPTPTTTTE